MEDEPTIPGPPPALAPTRMRVVFAAPQDRATPIHALRTGTFADSMGRETTFTADDLRQMAARLNETAQKRRPPINEGHDFGRAVGRMLEAYTRHGDNHLYIVPRWNSQGQELLAEEVYDAFSIELDTSSGYTVIGGALTNYPAVHGLKPVSLAAPDAGAVPVVALPPADVPAADEPTQETPPMPDETQAAPPAPSVAPPAPPVVSLNLDDPTIRAQMEAYQTEMRAAYQRQHELAMQAAREQARVEFERWKADEGRRAALLAFAQHATTPTLARPTSVAWTVEQVMDALTAPTAEKVQAIFRDALDGALLVSGMAAGSSRGDDAGDDAARFNALVFEQQKQGMSQADAIRAVARQHPALYHAMNTPKGGR